MVWYKGVGFVLIRINIEKLISFYLSTYTAYLCHHNSLIKSWDWSYQKVEARAKEDGQVYDQVDPIAYPRVNYQHHRNER